MNTQLILVVGTWNEADIFGRKKKCFYLAPLEENLFLEANDLCEQQASTAVCIILFASSKW